MEASDCSCHYFCSSSSLTTLLKENTERHTDNFAHKGSCFVVISAETLISEKDKAYLEPCNCACQQTASQLSPLIACLYQGERLDQRSCEALEAVLKSLHFDFINLQAAQLEENVSFMRKLIFLIFALPIHFHIQAFSVSDQKSFLSSKRTS